MKKPTTPLGNSLQTPYLALNDAIAKEWEEIKTKKPDPMGMPFTRLASAAIDLIAPERDDVIDELASYGETDLLCYRSADSKELRAQQDDEWNSLLQWAEEHLGVKLVATEGIMPIKQSLDALVSLRNHLVSCNEFQLSALTMLSAHTASLIIPLALKENAISAEDAIRKSQLEENFQTDQWGSDEAKQQRLDRAASDIRQASRFLALLTT